MFHGGPCQRKSRSMPTTTTSCPGGKSWRCKSQGSILLLVCFIAFPTIVAFVTTRNATRHGTVLTSYTKIGCERGYFRPSGLFGSLGFYSPCFHTNTDMVLGDGRALPHIYHGSWIYCQIGDGQHRDIEGEAGWEVKCRP